MADERKYKTFEEFYPFYLSEHSLAADRFMHYIGTTIVIGLVVSAIITGKYWLIAATPVAGYAFAWFGHFVIEKNRPATFTYPFWSLMGDFKMYFQALTGTLPREHFVTKRDTSSPEMKTAE
ncbi:DUF962 domain-containing protein [Kordiimonas laminariae]|uniref:DUF962 domain-containing protein n=1 Tax=Kordiimonas laminariae TaxID=2917717 RepID=UPI001FF133B2|nr:DUF962 domain-containing protein [Kordiimonas laminariae]MCK0068090.1 DUF962 domain-containing protein [Kordiimonas laminariae]